MSDLKMSTAPQQKRSDTPKVTRGLRQHMVDFHKTLHAPRRMNVVEHVKNDVLPWFLPLFDRGLQSTAPATKNDPEASEVLHLPRRILIMPDIKMTAGSENEIFNPFKMSFKCTKQYIIAVPATQKRHPKPPSHFDPRLPTF